MIILAGNFGANDVITMAHGSGGQAGHELMEKILLPAFDNPILREMHDGAKLDLSTNKIAFTTANRSFVRQSN